MKEDLHVAISSTIKKDPKSTMRIIPISLPTPFYIGPVNVYLIAEDPITLIDTGPKTKEAIEALREGLRKARIRVSDIRRIVLTHAHEDHCGLARSLRDEAKDAEVLVHKWETGHRVGRLEYAEHRTLLERAGVPADEIAGMRKMYEGVRQYADSFKEDEYDELHDEAELEFETGALRIVHTPGHTPGSCSFVREADRTVIAGDCVLKRITPNPVLSPDPIDSSKRFPSLAEYLVSLARLRTFRAHAGARGPRRASPRFRRAIQSLLSRHSRTPERTLFVWFRKPAPLPGTLRGKCFPALTMCTDFSRSRRRWRISTWRILKERLNSNSPSRRKFTARFLQTRHRKRPAEDFAARPRQLTIKHFPLRFDRSICRIQAASPQGDLASRFTAGSRGLNIWRPLQRPFDRSHSKAV